MSWPRRRSAALRRVLLGMIGCAMALAATACSDDAGAGTDVPVVRVIAGPADTEYAFEMSEQLAAGPARLTVSNGGGEPHHAQVFRFEEGATLTDVTAALAEGGPGAAMEFGTFVGGTGLVAPGEESRADAVLDLAPGNYAVLCFVPDGDGVPHLAHGMAREFEVTAGDDPIDAPVADAEVRLVDYDFDLPDTIEGDTVLAVTNGAEAEAHELVIARLDGDVGVDDVLAALHHDEPLPAVPLGGMQALPPGATQHLQLDLEPGRYVVLCAVPSPDGTEHYDAGMIEEVTVT